MKVRKAFKKSGVDVDVADIIMVFVFYWFYFEKQDLSIKMRFRRKKIIYLGRYLYKWKIKQMTYFSRKKFNLYTA